MREDFRPGTFVNEVVSEMKFEKYLENLARQREFNKQKKEEVKSA